MSFVDGENLAIRAKEVFQAAKAALPPSPWYEPDAFIWLPHTSALAPLPRLGRGVFELQGIAVRAHYYTSVRGDTPRVDSVRRALRWLGFQPEVFKREGKQPKAKGVDIALSKDLLSHGFSRHYDVAVLFSNDGDYVPLIQEIKRAGRRVCIAGFRGFGLHPELEVEADAFFDLTRLFLQASSMVTNTAAWASIGGGQSSLHCQVCFRVVTFAAGSAPPGWVPTALEDEQRTKLLFCPDCSERAGAKPLEDPFVLSAVLQPGDPLRS
jgi:hypothetical protein